MMVGDVETMPERFEDKLQLLQDILQSGIERLLNEAKKRDSLAPPYGKAPYPTPLISEEEFYKSGSYSEPLGVNDDPQFKYEYGFNPLRYLGEFIKWAHPDTAMSRKENKIKALERLRFVGKHALHCLDVCDEIKENSSLLRSGIIWGPLTSPINSTTVSVLCQPIRSGIVIFQLSHTNTFDEIIKTFSVEFNAFPDLAEGSEEPYLSYFTPLKGKFENLMPGKQYFVRCCLQDKNFDKPKVEKTENKSEFDLDSDDLMEGDGEVKGEGNEEAKTDASQEETFRFHGPAEGLFQHGSFWTIPTDEITTTNENENEDGESQVSEQNQNQTNKGFTYPPLSIFAIDAYQAVQYQQQHGCSLRHLVSSEHPSVSCLLGDMFREHGDEMDDCSKLYSNQIFDAYRKCCLFSEDLCKSTSMLFAWNDTRKGSDVDLRAEEIAYKQYLHDVKKHDKKVNQSKKLSRSSSSAQVTSVPPAPVLERPPVTPSLQWITNALPVNWQEDSTRKLYQTVMIGPDVQVFLLDHRSNYLGKAQAKWLRERLETSEALWKIVCCGLPLGVRIVAQNNSAGSRSRVASAVGNALLESSQEGAEGAEKEDNGNEDGNNNNNGNARVSMQVPNAVDHDETDECGRPKTSLHYVLASIQRRMESKLQKDDSSSVGELEGDAKTGIVDTEAQGSAKIEDGVASININGNNNNDGRSVNEDGGTQNSPTIEAQASEFNVNDEDCASMSESHSTARGEVSMESGIVVLSSGCSQPYIASYDPRVWGRPFLCEVHVGYSKADDKQPLEEEEVPYMKPSYVFHSSQIMASPSSLLELDRSALETTEPQQQSTHNTHDLVAAKLFLEVDGSLVVTMVDAKGNSIYQSVLRTAMPK